MANLPVVLTKQQQAQTLANYMPSGKAFAAKNIVGSVLRKLLLGFATEILRVDTWIALFRTDTVPDQTKNFISEWESALGIPDSCFKGTGTDTARRLAIEIKLAGQGVQTAQDFVDLADKFGISITAESGSLHYIHGALPFKDYPDEKTARNTLVIKPTEAIGAAFPYTFPIVFGTSELATLECLFRKLKPANVDLVFESV